MSQIIPRTPGGPASNQLPEGFNRSEGKHLSRQQNAEVARGLVAGTRVHAAAVVAAIGLQTTAMLSREATFQAHGDRNAANRLNFIVDQYASFVGNEVARFGR